MCSSSAPTSPRSCSNLGRAAPATPDGSRWAPATSVPTSASWSAWSPRWNRRIERIPAGHDSLPISVENPFIIAALEEFAGLARLLGTANRDLEKRARMLLGRLFGESRKAGIRLWLIAQ